ncbi:MAG TPA: HTH domain-containing protein [Microthrixaceae bacterium]|nr:HTH domain-containing protein [Microthrixaceae bacterium]
MAKKQSRTDAERRVRQCERLGRLLQTLQLIMGKGRWDADGLAQELECSRRTVYRLLQTLSMAGVPWFFDDKIRAYRVRPGFRFPELDRQSKADASVDIATLKPAIAQLIVDAEDFLGSLRTFQEQLQAVRPDLPGE